MDVTCDNCKAEYDFDDTLLGDKGTTVKCSKCGHVFRVMPPRREPARSALKVRFVDGHVESVASLRELQQRIQAGHVGVDDQLGRDGFTFRRLGDVPELKNFFGRSAPASGPVPTAAAAAQNHDLPHRGEPRPAPKRTMLGVGATDIPTAPRMPNFGPIVAAQALAPTQPGATTPKSTLQGRSPISSAPTANMPMPPRDAPREAPRPAPISNAPTPTSPAPTASGTAPTKQATPSYAASAGAAAATSAASPSATAATQLAEPSPLPARASAGPVMHRPAGPALRISDSVSEGPMRPDGPSSPRSPGLDSIAPGALKAASMPQSGAPRPATGKGVRLSLEEDELPERERSSGGTRWLLYLCALALLGGGGFFVVKHMAADKAAEPKAVALPATENASPPPTPALTADAGATSAAQAPAQPVPAAALEALEQPAPPSAPAPSEKPPAKPDAPAASKPPAAASASGGEREKASEGAAGGREPKDYSGWVQRGDQLLAKRDLAGAQHAFETAVALRGTGSEANSGLGAALLGLGQTREAVPFLTRAANNGFAEASVSLGDAYRKLGDKDNAIEAYETYLARLPRGARASYVKLQLEGLGKDVGGAKPEAEPAQKPSGQAAPSEYRPAGELSEPAPAAPAPAAPESPQ